MTQTMINEPGWYKFANWERQRMWDWLSIREPEIAAWWDGSFHAVQPRMLWGEQKEDILVVLKNKNEERRSIAYKLVEIEHESSVDAGAV